MEKAIETLKVLLDLLNDREIEQYVSLIDPYLMLISYILSGYPQATALCSARNRAPHDVRLLGIVSTSGKSLGTIRGQLQPRQSWHGTNSIGQELMGENRPSHARCIVRHHHQVN